VCYLSVFVQKRQYCTYLSLIILDQPKANFRNEKVDWVLFKLTCFKLVNNSNEFHKSPFGGYFPLFADLHISNHKPIVSNCKTVRWIFIVQRFVCSALKVKSFHTKAKFGFFTLVFTFANISDLGYKSTVL